MDLSKTLKWRDGNRNGNANADAKVSTIALPVLCTGELKSMLTSRPSHFSFEYYIAGLCETKILLDHCKFFSKILIYY